MDAQAQTRIIDRLTAEITVLRDQIEDEILWGVGIDASITTATLKAIISAINRRFR